MTEQDQNSLELKITKELVGKTVQCARFMTEQEATESGWTKRPIVIVFRDRTLLIPIADDEGNDGGAMVIQHCSDPKRDITIGTI